MQDEEFSELEKAKLRYLDKLILEIDDAVRALNGLINDIKIQKNLFD